MRHAVMHPQTTWPAGALGAVSDRVDTAGPPSAPDWPVYVARRKIYFMDCVIKELQVPESDPVP